MERGKGMHELLRKAATDYLKASLARCTDAQRLMFKRMYAGGQLDAQIDTVVDRMPDEKLETAMDQVQRTLAKASA